MVNSKQFLLNMIIEVEELALNSRKKLLDGVEKRLLNLRDSFNIYIMTADTHGTAKTLKKQLGVQFVPMEKNYGMVQKLEFLKRIGEGSTITIGNTKEDSGTRTSTVTVGGESTLPFLLSELTKIAPPTPPETNPPSAH